MKSRSIATNDCRTGRTSGQRPSHSRRAVLAMDGNGTNLSRTWVRLRARDGGGVEGGLRRDGHGLLRRCAVLHSTQWALPTAAREPQTMILDWRHLPTVDPRVRFGRRRPMCCTSVLTGPSSRARSPGRSTEGGRALISDPGRVGSPMFFDALRDVGLRHVGASVVKVSMHGREYPDHRARNRSIEKKARRPWGPARLRRSRHGRSPLLLVRAALGLRVQFAAALPAREPDLRHVRVLGARLVGALGHGEADRDADRVLGQ